MLSFRNFLRLGNPLCCNINDVTIQDLEKEPWEREKELGEREKELGEGEKEVGEGDKELGEGEKEPGKEKRAEASATLEEQKEALKEKQITEAHSSCETTQYGSSLSLARIQSLVSMTTPRHGYQPGIIGNPPFVEFDLSIDGFGSLFLPSAFPQSIDQNIHPQVPHAHMMSAVTGNTTGIGGGGERPFPPSNGLTFSTWIFFSRYIEQSVNFRHINCKPVRTGRVLDFEFVYHWLCDYLACTDWQTVKVYIQVCAHT